MKRRHDHLHDLLNWISYNRGTVAALAIGVISALFLVSCEPKTQSLIDHARSVTAPELASEIAAVESDFAGKMKAAELAKADLEAQIKRRQEFVALAGQVGNMAATGAISPGGMAGAVVQLLTLALAAGLLYDNRRKDKLIRTVKTINKATDALSKEP